MNTRREITAVLLGLPLVTTATAQNQPPVLHEEMHPCSEAAARIISYTLYAEARGEPFDGKKAVASVIKTRSMRSGMSLAETCLQDGQFSCWTGLKAVPDFYVSAEGISAKDLRARSQCYAITWVLLEGMKTWDYLTHFYNPDKVTPVWAKDLKGRRVIGRHVFGYID